jgi:hypothetical protein
MLPRSPPSACSAGSSSEPPACSARRTSQSDNPAGQRWLTSTCGSYLIARATRARALLHALQRVAVERVLGLVCGALGTARIRPIGWAAEVVRVYRLQPSSRLITARHRRNHRSSEQHGRPHGSCCCAAPRRWRPSPALAPLRAPATRTRRGCSHGLAPDLIVVSSKCFSENSYSCSIVASVLQTFGPFRTMPGRASGMRHPQVAIETVAAAGAEPAARARAPAPRGPWCAGVRVAASQIDGAGRAAACAPRRHGASGGRGPHNQLGGAPPRGAAGCPVPTAERRDKGDDAAAIGRDGTQGKREFWIYKLRL